MLVIAGVVDFDAATPSAQLDADCRRLAGSDDQSVRLTSRPGASFATSGRQVAVDRRAAPEPPDLMVAADIRLDGRAALARQLGLADASDDASLIRACWRRWGAACLAHLSGDFAIAVWCAQSRQLWLARDPMGQRPLFVCRHGRQLAFASGLRALRQFAGYLDPDPIALADHLLGLPGDPTRTAWRRIQRIPAGHVCRDDAAGVSDCRRYAHLQAPEDSDGRSEADWRAGFGQCFRSAVLDRLSANEPIAVSLSGGLDSSSVVAMARQLRAGATVRAYAARFPATPDCDEGHHLDAMRRLSGVHVIDVDGSIASPLRSYAELLPCLDEPILIQNLHLWTSLYAAAQADGIRSMLDGHDGDSALGRVGGAGAGSTSATGPLRAWPVRQLQRLRARLRRPPQALPLSLMSADFRRASSATQRLDDFSANRGAALAGDLRAQHGWQLNSGYAAYATERIGSLAGNFGIEARHPFYDIRLLRWCLGLPAELKTRDGYTRWILRAEMAGLLPDALRWRRDKTLLSAQFHRAFRDLDGELMTRLLAQSKGALAAYVDLGKVNALWADYRRQPSDRVSTALWAIATLGLWLQEAELRSAAQA